MSPVVFVSPRPQVFVLPSTQSGERYAPLIVSALALLLSAYALRKTLLQKRNEHAGKFFHELVVDKSAEDILTFHAELRTFVEEQSRRLSSLPVDDAEMRRALHQVRQMKRATSGKVAMLAGAFDPNLEDRIEQLFDSISDFTENWLAKRAAGDDAGGEPIDRIIARSQRSILTALRDYEFRLAWPAPWRRFRHWFGRWRFTGDNVDG